MTQRAFLLACVATLILGFCVSPARGQNDIENPATFPGVWYRLAVDNNGNYVTGDGDGSGWYYYPNRDVWRMWYYNGPYDPSRKATLQYHVYTKAYDTNYSTYVVAQFGWTTPEWSSLGRSGPPTPADLPSTTEDSKYVSTWGIYSIDYPVFGSVEAIRDCYIDDYNPEWVCIELSARNAYVYRGAFHECQPKESETGLGACCNHQTGYCYLSTEADCPASMDWLGLGTTCDQCTVTANTGTDFGDAPDEDYLTLRARDGARHTIVSGVYLGSGVDGESDGQPNATATGDDSHGADEDGIAFTSTLQPGREATISVTASVNGYLNAWIDFGANGQFSDSEDVIFVDQVLKRGVNRLSFRVPTDAVSGSTFARFRFNTRGLLDSYGPADDGEVEDYRVQVVTTYDAKDISGASRLTWSQPPSPADGQALVFETGAVSSSLHLHEMAADEWQPVEGQPLTAIHWWSTFDGWNESYLPPDLPLAFHIGIWTNVPDSSPSDPSTFAHPGTLVWETYCTNWSWAVSGHESSADKSQSGQTCFLFSHQLSQDRWFEVSPTGSVKSETGTCVYWLSISALYDPTGDGPSHIWTWKTRPVASGAAGVIMATITPPTGAASWPPTVGSQWLTGIRQPDLADMAFQLTTFSPLEFETHTSTETGLGELAILAADWLNAVK